MLLQGGTAEEQAHTEALAAPVVLEDERIPELVSSTHDVLPPDDSQRVRRWDAEGSKRLVLGHLADLKFKGPTVVYDGAAMPLQPGKHGTRVLGGITVIARVRGGAHP